MSDLFGGAIAPAAAPRPRPAAGAAGYRPEIVQAAPGMWVIVTFALIPKNGYGHLHFPHYWGGPQHATRWRVDRHGSGAPNGTFIFGSHADATATAVEVFGDTTDLHPFMGRVEIPSDDHRPRAAGRRAARHLTNLEGVSTRA